MMARWVMDLSPGTDKLPRNGRPGVTVREAVAITPTSWPNLDTLSLAAFRCGEWKESLDARRKMIEMRPTRLEDKLFLAMTHWHLGAKDEARKWHAEASAEFEKDPQKHEAVGPIKQEADLLIGESPEPQATNEPTPPP